ncbi:FAD/NAD(P)-binding protein [Variovorax paradoxus]|uniref:FAD/NAD(P)-binding protein n=1 Tax=Variovorax paradoxus TaxID=34073 RepID=UPI002789E9B7|nr:FAD/NAD(P)-binding protein [Variovorax paradoxus]MDQ0589039.1 putative NAD(P)/FAD-binding protein YdhS [Variovorax paradoxus]
MGQPVQVVILGGGFSGAVTAIHLVRGSRPRELRITVVNPTPDVGRGLAYRFDDDNLLLNVPAGNMSALVDEPGHFVAYCQRIDPSLSSGSFVSRRLYGQYLQDLWAQTEAAHPGVIRKRVDEAVGLKRATNGSGWDVTLASGQHLSADQVVLAVGHQAPRFPIPLEPEARARVIEPWDFAAMHRLPSDQPVVIVGTGHTAVDALFCLAQSRPRRPIYLVSRHGLLPHRHRLSTTPPKPPLAFPDYLRNVPPTVRACTRALRQNLKALAERGGDWRDALNELRPHTPQLWQSWPVAEQRRFLRHLQAQWDVHRHRLAHMAAQRLDHLLAEGRAQVIAGRIITIRQQSDGVEVAYRARGERHIEHLSASAVINCVGPDTDIQRHANPLLAQLLTDGLIRPDAHGLGLMVMPDLQLQSAHQQPVEGLWYVGPLLKGLMWEATAVPELRLRAQRLTRHLLSHQGHTVAEALG